MYSVKDVVESKNIAVFGASRDMLKPGSMLIYSLKETGFTGNVAGINPQGGEAFGVPLYAKLADVPFPVDLAVMIIPPAAVVQSLMECAQRGVQRGRAGGYGPVIMHPFDIQTEFGGDLLVCRFVSDQVV